MLFIPDEMEDGVNESKLSVAPSMILRMPNECLNRDCDKVRNKVEDPFKGLFLMFTV